MPETMRRIEISAEDISRFWSKVEIKSDAECWPWKAGKDRFGRGKYWHGGRYYFSPRFVLMLADGLLRPPNIFACHSCDNPSCVNPKHLWWGDRAANMRDCGAKGRHGFQIRYRGSANPQSKLTEDDVRNIRRRYADGVLPGVLAAEYGIISSSVWKIATGRSWQHVR